MALSMTYMLFKICSRGLYYIIIII